ncbi:phage protease [Aliivibrio wodanis]|uniref:phage protease n=1 Tax=Aliivibrio wodanis TaxID=80852 RepID=UPI00406C63DA
MSRKLYTALCFNLTTTVSPEGLWLPMIPSGSFSGIDKRSWTNSNPDAVVAAFKKKLPFDVEHSTHLKAPNGDPAPAVGWITELQNRNGEVYGKVEWNSEGHELIEEKKYAYYSPSFTYDESGIVIELASSGLTNSPNLNVPALNRREEEDMKFSPAIVAALSLSAEATEEQVLTAINSIKSEKQIALNSAQQPDLTKFVPKDTYSIALNRAETAEGKLKAVEDAEIEALVDSAISDGKIAPANKDMFVGMCRAEGGKENFSAFVATAAAVVSDKEDKKPNLATNSKLDKEELALCRKMNLTAEEFLKSKESIADYNEQNKDA